MIMIWRQIPRSRIHRISAFHSHLHSRRPHIPTYTRILNRNMPCPTFPDFLPMPSLYCKPAEGYGYAVQLEWK